MDVDTKLEQETEQAAKVASGCPFDMNSFVEALDLETGDTPETPLKAHALYDILRTHHPVTRVAFRRPPGAPVDDESLSPAEKAQRESFNRPMHLITHYEEGSAALLDDRFSVDRMKMLTPEQRAEIEKEGEEGDPIFRPFTRSILSLDPPDHTRLRKLVQPSFTNRAVEAWRPIIQSLTDDLLDRAEQEAAERGETAPNRRMDLYEAFAHPLPVQVISAVLGIPKEDHQMAKRWAGFLLRADRDSAQTNEEVREGLRDFVDYMQRLADDKRRNPADDLISQLVQAEEDGDRLNGDDLMGMIFILYIAGFVTTVNLIDSAVVALLTHPDQLAKLKTDPTLAKGAVEETLRYWGSLESSLPRVATEDVEIAGVTIPEGELMMVSLAAADRDPARFANPQAYDITRPDANRHIAFGKGIHVCLGAPLARLEGQIALETLIRRYPDLRLAVPTEELAWTSSLLRGFTSVPLFF